MLLRKFRGRTGTNLLGVFEKENSTWRKLRNYGWEKNEKLWLFEGAYTDKFWHAFLNVFAAYVDEFPRVWTTVTSRFCGSFKVGKKTWAHGSGASNVKRRRQSCRSKETEGVIRKTMWPTESCCSSAAASNSYSSAGTIATAIVDKFRHERGSRPSGCSTLSPSFLWTYRRFGKTNKLR